MVFYMIGTIFKIMGIAMLAPLFISLGFGESVLPFVYTLIIFLGLGFALGPKRPKDQTMYAKEGIVVVCISWICISLIGCLPYIFSKEIPYFVNALFETVSGFTTTGSSVVNNVEALSKGILFWRSFTHFLGGMGILFILLVVMPKSESGAMHLLKVESGGPKVEKLTSKIKYTALILYAIYLVLMLVYFIFLLCGGVGWFDALTLSFSVAGTGGFTNYNNGILHFGSLYIEIITSVFMMMFAINFAIYFLIITGKFIQVLKNEELRTFIIIIFISIIFISLNIMNQVGGFGEALRQSSINILSIISCTGISSYDFSVWPAFSKVLLIMLTMLGGCAGSTAGGYKVTRLVSLTKISAFKIKSSVNPRSMAVLKIEGKPQDDSYISGIMFFTVIYFMVVCVSTLVMSIDPATDVTTSLTTTLFNFNNVGLGLGNTNANIIASLTGFSKVFLSFVMLVGRLDIIPILILFAPSTWRRRYA